MISKRAIAPLVATLLLISFATSLGVVIMNFGQAQVELQAQCAVDINLKLAEIGGKADLCYSSSEKNLHFTTENGININVEGLIVNVIGSKKAETIELLDAKMTKAGTYIANINYDTALSGQARQVKITPVVLLYDQQQICLEKSVIVETIPEC